MMETEAMAAGSDQTDEELVALSLQGNQEAFAQIVARYQSLVCSVTYSATGNLHRSEDLAQETFIAAWKELRHLREPGRFKSWLCAIARNRIHTAFRKQHREPLHCAEELEQAPEVVSNEAPSMHVITEEEENILWRSLERIPEIYREPLILFFRQDRSVKQVAAALELSEDAVKKRLLRGRNLLQEEVRALIEGALERTKPGKAFTVGVLSALPLFAAGSASAATLGALKTGTVGKAALGFGLGASALGPFLGLLGAIAGPWASIRNTRSPRERQFMIRQTFVLLAFVTLFLAALFGLISWGRSVATHSRLAFGCAMAGLILVYCTGLVAMILKVNRRQRQIRIEDGTDDLLGGLSGSSKDVARPLKAQVYGSVGGSTIGALAWMVIQALRLQQWFTAAAIVVFGLVVFIVSSRTWLRHPEKQRRVMLWTIAVLGVFTLLICGLNGREWVKSLRK
jgi:RNA polymerase sigma factor (sigma-70 family)